MTKVVPKVRITTAKGVLHRAYIVLLEGSIPEHDP